MKRSAPTEPEPRLASLLATLLLSGLLALGAGCEAAPKEPEMPVNLAREHARSEGAYLGERVLVDANEAILLHPLSSRQRLSRETLLRIDELVKPTTQYPETESRP